MNKQINQKTACVSCGKCTSACEFLEKYHMDFSEEGKVKDLAYHCMLCGKCTEVCPKHIDGKQMVMDMRNQIVAENKGKIAGYGGLRFEKERYKFKNYKHGKKKSVLFPGCNYPSLFPQSMKALEELMDSHDIGIVYDCCGKPIAELGLVAQKDAIITQLNQRFLQMGIEEIIVVCPNCYYYLRDKLRVNVVTIYEKLSSLGIGERIQGISIGERIQGTSCGERIHIFPPCPDRKEQLWLDQMQPYLPAEIKLIKEVQCCGLGGLAPKMEPEFPSILGQKLAEYKVQNQVEDIYVYCASCGGSFYRNGVANVHHILNEILGCKEAPDIKSSMINRIKTKWK